MAFTFEKLVVYQKALDDSPTATRKIFSLLLAAEPGNLFPPPDFSLRRAKVIEPGIVSPLRPRRDALCLTQRGHQFVDRGQIGGDTAFFDPVQCFGPNTRFSGQLGL